MLGFLRSIFGEKVDITSYEYMKTIPVYIQDNYSILLMSWEENQCILLSPNDHSRRLPTLKKQFKNFQSFCDFPSALYLHGLTSQQRRNLIENKIPFISEPQQVYLPFWGCVFAEKFNSAAVPPKTMAPGAQRLFLYLYYFDKIERTNLTDLSAKLCISKATCTRAANDLLSAGLITIDKEGRNKWIVSRFNKPEFLRKGYSRLKSPVERVIYVKDIPPAGHFFQSNVKALSSLTLVSAKGCDKGLAASPKTASSIPTDIIISERDFEDFGGYPIEVWSYDPALFAENGRVDDISLLVSLDSDPDERIQMGLDELREKHGLPIKYDE